MTCSLTSEDAAIDGLFRLKQTMFQGLFLLGIWRPWLAWTTTSG